MGASINRRQIAAASEVTPGTAVTVTAAHHIPRIRNPRWKPIPTLVDRDIISQSYSDYPPLVSGASQVEFTFESELGGHPSNPPVTQFYSAAHWSRLLTACGFSAHGVMALPIGRIVGGPFQRGETIAQATGGPAAGVVMTTTFDGDDILWMLSEGHTLTSGSFNTTGTVVGLTSGATTVPTAAVDTTTAKEVGGWRPTSGTDFTLTMTLNTGEKIIRAAGCLGTVQFPLQYGEPVRASWTFRGIFVDYTDAGAYTGGTLVDSQTTPSTFLNPDLLLTDGTDFYGKAFPAKGTLTFNAQPNDGDQIVLDDGPNPAVTYEFDNDASVVESTTLQQVVIGADRAATITALIAKINTPAASALMGITAYESVGTNATGTDSVYLVNDMAGTAGNVTITVPVGAARITATGMSGGKSASNQVLSQITLDVANDVQLRTNALSAQGYDRARIVDRTPTGTFDPDEVTNATFDFFDNLKTGTPMRLRMRVGSTAGRKVYFLAPAVTFRDWTDGDRAGIQTAGLTFTLAAPEQGNTVAADDELVIINE